MLRLIKSEVLERDIVEYTYKLKFNGGESAILVVAEEPSLDGIDAFTAVEYSFNNEHYNFCQFNDYESVENSFPKDLQLLINDELEKEGFSFRI